MTEKKMKVTDKRLFTSDGELKNEYRHLEDQAPSEPTESVDSPVEEPQPKQPREDQNTVAAGDAQTPPTAPGYTAPTFLDLVGVVAQPIALYLGDAKMPDGESLENLDLARLYIDLLEVLYKKSENNLTPDEESLLKDLLYQLRLRYVEKTA